MLLQEVRAEPNEISGLSQQDPAEMADASWELVTRVLNAMARDGLLELGRRRIRLRDTERIRGFLDQHS